MRYLFWYCILFAALRVGAVAYKSEGPRTLTSEKNPPAAAVRIRLVTGYGIELDGETNVDLFQDESGGSNLAARFQRGVATGIPYGDYRLRVRATGFWSTEREVRVFQPNVSAVVALEVGGIDGGFPTSKVVGKVEDLKPSTPSMLARISGVYSTTVMDSPLNADGGFEFSGVPDGIYVLIIASEGRSAITKPGEVLQCRQVSVPLAAPILIELKK